MLPKRRIVRPDLSRIVAERHRAIVEKLHKQGKVLINELGINQKSLGNRQRRTHEFNINSTRRVLWVEPDEAKRIIAAFNPANHPLLLKNPTFISHTEAVNKLGSVSYLITLLDSGQIKTTIETNPKGKKIRHIVRESFETFLKTRGQTRRGKTKEGKVPKTSSQKTKKTPPQTSPTLTHEEAMARIRAANERAREIIARKEAEEFP